MKNLNLECEKIAKMCEALKCDTSNKKLETEVLERISEINQYCIEQKTLPSKKETSKIKTVGKLLPKCNKALAKQFTRFILIEHSINIYKAS